MTDAVIHPDLVSFDAAAHDRLAADPVRNTIALTALDLARRQPDQSDPPTLITFHDTSGTLIGTAVRTPPWSLLTADLPPTAIPAAIAVLRKADPNLPGVTGPQPISEAFATAWTAATATDFRLNLATRLYRLGTLAAPAVPGAGRQATEDDVPLLATWRERFKQEAVPDAPPEPPATDLLRNSLRAGAGHAIWEHNGTPVAWAQANHPIEGMTRVGPVYTPPEHRRNGYGAAATATATRWAQAQGATTVLLFADLTNPTSNSIYQRIGYQPLTDWAEYKWKP